MNAALFSRFAQLQRSQWANPDQLYAIQSRKLRRLVHHAYDRVPYYRDLMDRARIAPRDIATPKDLTKLPVTRKHDIANIDLGEIHAREIDPAVCTDLKTSGSQGIPFDVRFTRDDRTWWKLLAMRGWLANGYRPWHQILVLNDSRFEPRGRQWFEWLGMLRRRYVSIYDDVEIQADAAAAIRPQVLRGITSDVLRLGQELRRRGDTSVKPKLVLTSAELSDNASRRDIESIFGTNPIDYYGSIECGWIAWQCPQREGYHINADCLIVEFLQDGSPADPGEPAEIVVTNLHSDAMPFIRYSVGDMGILTDDRCTCGRGLPLMRTVEGRIADSVVLADNRRISPYQITCTVEQIPGIGRYQVYQPRVGDLIIRVIPNDLYTPETDAQLVSRLSELLGHQTKIEVDRVAEIGKGAGGKFQIVLSDPARVAPSTE